MFSIITRKGLNTIGTGNRHRQQGITSRPIRVLVCKFDIISQGIDWTAPYSLFSGAIA